MAGDVKNSRPGSGGLLKRLLQWPGRQEFFALLTVVLLAGGTWAFIELADEVREGETRSVDETILLLMRHPDDFSNPLGPAWFEEMCRDMTALGGVTVLGFLTIGACVYLFLDHRHRVITILVVAVIGGFFLSMLLKGIIDRPRPDLVPYESYVYTTSFPSGHSMMGAVTYLTLAGLLAHNHKKKRFRIYLFAVAVFLMLAIGFSRVYLGVHWPTDVLAGWTAGATWTLICLQVGHLWHHARAG